MSQDNANQGFALGDANGHFLLHVWCPYREALEQLRFGNVRSFLPLFLRVVGALLRTPA
jgi:hypothetical protein